MTFKITALFAALTISFIVTTPLAADDTAAAAGTEKTISPRVMADALHMVMEADRSVYTKEVVNRLTKKEKVIEASEHFEDDQALPLPAQMFRFGAEHTAKQAEKDPDINFSYSLQSLWPINKQNAPKTEAEKEGLQYVVDNPGKNYYTIEEVGGNDYFTAVYADVAIAPVCVSCHNDHKDSPRIDFKLRDTMGGVVIRILQD